MNELETANSFGIIFVIVAIVLCALIVWLKLRVIKLLCSIVENNWYKFLFKPFSLALPSATLACYKIEALKNQIPVDVFSWIDKHVGLIVFGYFMVPVVTGVEDFIKKKASEYSTSLSSEGASLLLKALDYAVDKKMNRFLSELSNTKESLTPGQVFQKITDPDRQVAEIVRAIHLFCESLASLSDTDEVEFNTVLFRMNGEVLVESWCFFPESNMPDQALLNDTQSLASNVARSGKMIIIEDIGKERKNKKSRISVQCQMEAGSALCYPIKCAPTKNIPLVLRITANKAFFSTEKRAMYEKIFERFKKRILIEYALSQFKSYASKKSS